LIVQAGDCLLGNMRPFKNLMQFGASFVKKDNFQYGGRGRGQLEFFRNVDIVYHQSTCVIYNLKFHRNQKRSGKIFQNGDRTLSLIFEICHFKK